MSESLPKILHHPSSSFGSTELVEVFEDHKKALRELIRSKLSGGGEEAIDDVMQELSLAINTIDEGTVSKEKSVAWLKQVAANKVKDHWRRVERKNRLHDELNQNSGSSLKDQKSPYEWILGLERTELVGDALKQLPPQERTALEKKYLENQSCREIALSTGTTEKAVEYRLGKARQQMRNILKKLL